MKSKKEKIKMLRENLEYNEEQFQSGNITRQQYSTRKRDALQAIRHHRAGTYPKWRER